LLHGAGGSSPLLTTQGHLLQLAHSAELLQGNSSAKFSGLCYRGPSGAEFMQVSACMGLAVGFWATSCAHRFPCLQSYLESKAMLQCLPFIMLKEGCERSCKARAARIPGPWLNSVAFHQALQEFVLRRVPCHQMGSLTLHRSRQPGSHGRHMLRGIHPKLFGIQGHAAMLAPHC